MSAAVPHRRPEIGDVVRVSVPVSGFDWATAAALANFCNGHGGQLVPFCAIGHTISASGSGTYPFYIAPKKRAVGRVWAIHMRGSTVDTTADVTINGSSAGTVAVPTTRGEPTAPFLFYENLSAKTNTAGGVNVVIDANTGDVTVAGIECYEQTRGELDANTDDYGIDITTLRPRVPIADVNYQSVAGALDAYKNLDCRRAGFFHLSTDTSVAPTITNGTAPGDALTQLPVTVTGTLDDYGATTSSVTVAVYAQVDSGAGIVRAVSTEGGATLNLSVTGTSFAWVTGSLTVGAEDVSTTDGLRSAWTDWEDVTLTAYVTTATQIDVAAIAIVRTTTPI